MRNIRSLGDWVLGCFGGAEGSLSHGRHCAARFGASAKLCHAAALGFVHVPSVTSQSTRQTARVKIVLRTVDWKNQFDFLIRAAPVSHQPQPPCWSSIVIVGFAIARMRFYRYLGCLFVVAIFAAQTATGGEIPLVLARRDRQFEEKTKRLGSTRSSGISFFSSPMFAPRLGAPAAMRNGGSDFQNFRLPEMCPRWDRRVNEFLCKIMRFVSVPRTTFSTNVRMSNKSHEQKDEVNGQRN
uniref:Uncharacterized protein n=1 Tax=Anopheles farauti TaxID=69004 RepID=A0A182Q9Y2_9DIPT